jgi:hypothetical protein
MTEWESRDRKRPIKVYVSGRERLEIERRAERVKLPVSTMMRDLALGFVLRSAFDRDAISALIKLHADQGRLGGLLKLWLTDRKGEAVSVTGVRSVLQQIESLQMELVHLVMTEKRRL